MRNQLYQTPHRIRRPQPLSDRLPPLLEIKNGTFYKEHPSTKNGNSPMFPGLNFNVKPIQSEEYWAVVGPSNAGKTTFLKVLAGQYISQPPLARSYPSLTRVHRSKYKTWDPKKAIQYVGFDSRSSLGGPEIKGAYMSARYESRREENDFTLLDYLTGNLSLNMDEKSIDRAQRAKQDSRFSKIVHGLSLEPLLTLPVSNLSNGQGRRARIARALTAKSRLLLLDEPFLGLDPMTATTLSRLLFSYSRRDGPRIVLSIPNNEEVPLWITHVIFIGDDHHIIAQGPKHHVAAKLDRRGYTFNIITGEMLLTKEAKTFKDGLEDSNPGTYAREVYQGSLHLKNNQESLEEVVKLKDGSQTFAEWDFRWYNPTSHYKVLDAMEADEKELLVEMCGVSVKYGGSEGQKVLGAGTQVIDGTEREGLWWNVCRGDRWGLFGPNGSGKTTLLSLICSDHPQAYSMPMKVFGRSRLATQSQPGISIFDLQARIGQASPEIHNYFPKTLSIRQTIENAWAETFRSRPSLTHEADDAVEAALRWFRRELDPGFDGVDPIDEIMPPSASAFTYVPKKERSIPEVLDNYLNMDLDWADNMTFGELSFTSQRVALFLRAIIKKPDLVILDEAFGGMDQYTRTKCMLFLAHGEKKWLTPRRAGTLIDRTTRRTLLHIHSKFAITGLETRQALINVSHRQQEVPPIVRSWICLPDNDNASTNRSPGFGTTPFASKHRWLERKWWSEIWVSTGTEGLHRRKRTKFKIAT